MLHATTTPSGSSPRAYLAGPCVMDEQLLHVGHKLLDVRFQCPESPLDFIELCLYDNHRASAIEQCDGKWVPGAVGGRVGWERNARERARGAEVVVDGWDWARKWRVCGGE